MRGQRRSVSGTFRGWTGQWAAALPLLLGRGAAAADGKSSQSVTHRRHRPEEGGLGLGPGEPPPGREDDVPGLSLLPGSLAAGFAASDRLPNPAPTPSARSREWGESGFGRSFRSLDAAESKANVCSASASCTQASGHQTLRWSLLLRPEQPQGRGKRPKHLKVKLLRLCGCGACIATAGLGTRPFLETVSCRLRVGRSGLKFELLRVPTVWP